MGLRVHIRVHPDRDRRHQAQFYRHLRQRFHLGLTLDVELPYATLQRQPHLLARLANTGKHDPRARHARGARAQVFAARHHVHPRARIAQKLENGDIAQRLHRETHKVLHPRECLVEQGKMAQECRSRIDISGRADRARDLGQRHILGPELPVPIEKMIHPCPRVAPSIRRARPPFILPKISSPKAPHPQRALPPGPWRSRRNR